MTSVAYVARAVLMAWALLLPAAARADDDTLQVGLVGAISMTHWRLKLGAVSECVLSSEARQCE